MDKSELIQKIMQKKEFSRLPLRDVEIAIEKFENKDLNDYQRVKVIRRFLRDIFSSFSSRKVFSVKGKEKEWYLMKHKSSRERMSYYKEIYSKILNGFEEVSIVDLGAGINGLSYDFFPAETKVNYVGVEAIGQFVDLMNDIFGKEKANAIAIQLSLFELDKIKKVVAQTKNPKVVFLLKVVDSLEVVERDYSKKLLSEIAPLCDRIVVSYATRSLGARKKFSAQRGWLIKFIDENFRKIDDFELGGEQYLIFENKK